MSLLTRMKDVDWACTERFLWDYGYARLGQLLTPAQCRALAEMYTQPDLFRSTIDMARFRFGEGEYKYFAYPLPELVETFRTAAYPDLAPIANRWMEALRIEQRFPIRFSDLLAECSAAGQTKPTPLLLHYEAGGYNCLHQDLYGAIAFPFQIVCLLSERERDYTGGEFLLVEQRPRAQSIGQVIQAEAGEAIVFTTRYKPVASAKGHSRANVKHGVSRIRSGTRYTLGIIFHDAE